MENAQRTERIVKLRALSVAVTDGTCRNERSAR